MDPVTLYEGVNYSGLAVPVGEGNVRYVTAEQFNDSASSIRITSGFCAVLYEHANENGGYGLSVDLLEDCPDLSVYGFDKLTSYVRVFRIDRDKFTWVRGTTKDGQFVPGHWERKRASGAPAVAALAVVGPSLGPPTTPDEPHTDGPAVREHRGEEERLGPPGEHEGTGWGDGARDHRAEHTPFRLEHPLVSRLLEVVQHDEGDGIYFTVAASGTFKVMHPGVLHRKASACVRHSYRLDSTPGETLPKEPGVIDEVRGGAGSGPGSNPGSGGGVDKPEVNDEYFDVDLRLYDPDGNLFENPDVTAADLVRHRTLRGLARPWSFELSGRSRTYRLNPATFESVTNPRGSLEVRLTETIPSSSGTPLVDRRPLSADVQRFLFDLYRVGEFVADVTPIAPDGDSWQGSLRLVDPDGTEIARSGTGYLRCPIKPAMLARSRDTAHAARLWTLEVLPQAGTALAGTHTVGATVRGQLRVNTETAHSRLDMLFGEDGKNLELVCKDVGDQMQFWLTIHNIAAAETIDMRGLLDDRLPRDPMDPWEPLDVTAETELPIGSADNHYTTDRIPALETTFTFRFKVGSLQTTSISASVVPSEFDPSGAPVVRLEVGVEGQLEVFTTGIADYSLATVAVRDNRLVVEVGIVVDEQGMPKIVPAV